MSIGGLPRAVIECRGFAGALVLACGEGVVSAPLVAELDRRRCGSNSARATRSAAEGGRRSDAVVVMELSSWLPPLTPGPRRGHDGVVNTTLIVIDVQEDSRTWALCGEVFDRHHDLVLDKRLPGSFTGASLEERLGERAIDPVTIVGYMTNIRCDTTARQACTAASGQRCSTTPSVFP
jgi:hypothetical protein